jgi:hypothetical protein
LLCLIYLLTFLCILGEILVSNQESRVKKKNSQSYFMKHITNMVRADGVLCFVSDIFNRTKDIHFNQDEWYVYHSVKHLSLTNSHWNQSWKNVGFFPFFRGNNSWRKKNSIIIISLNVTCFRRVIAQRYSWSKYSLTHCFLAVEFAWKMFRSINIISYIQSGISTNILEKF